MFFRLESFLLVLDREFRMSAFYQVVLSSRCDNVRGDLLIDKLGYHIT